MPSKVMGPVCPRCWQERCYSARLAGRVLDYGDPERMYWVRPSDGARAAAVTRWDLGWWRCVWCGFRGTADDIHLFLDAIAPHPVGQASDLIQESLGVVFGRGR